MWTEQDYWVSFICVDVISFTVVATSSMTMFVDVTAADKRRFYYKFIFKYLRTAILRPNLWTKVAAGRKTFNKKGGIVLVRRLFNVIYPFLSFFVCRSTALGFILSAATI